MRTVLVLVLVVCGAGCGGGIAFPPGDDDGWIDPGNPGPFGCEDTSCPSGQICARIGGCTPAEEVRAVHVLWTLSGQPANRTTCDATQNLSIRFARPEEYGLGYSPVPCSQGKFTIDKLPRAYSKVVLGLEHGSGEEYPGMLDATTGETTIDLPF